MIKEIHGSITTPRGFSASGVACGIKSGTGKLDLGLIHSDSPCVAAAVFTQSSVVSAHVIRGRNQIAKGELQSVVANSGNANACTGEKGVEDANEAACSVGNSLQVSPSRVFVASTGVIGVPLPMDRIRTGIDEAASALDSGAQAGHAFARAIMTTDTRPKEVAVEVQAGNVRGTVAGAAKGSGMIAPNMATMLCFLTTDLCVSRELADEALRAAVDESFNRITVDGHRSPSDTVVLLANGEAGNSRLARGRKKSEEFADAVLYACTRLAEEIVRDAEGATKFIEVRVTGARTVKQAETVAREIADSPLVKTAANGEDPNWGRIVTAAGNSGVKLDPNKLVLHIGKEVAYEHGLPSDVPKQRLSEEMKSPELLFWLDLGQGKKKASVWTCDFSCDYVKINAEYTT